MSESEPRLVVFETDIGWVGVMHYDKVLHRVRLGFATMLDAALAFREHCVGPDEPNGWEKKLIRRFTKSLTYGANKSKSKTAFCYDDIELDDEGLTDFQRLSLIHI